MSKADTAIKQVFGSIGITDMDSLVDWLETLKPQYNVVKSTICIHDAISLIDALLDKGISSWYDKCRGWYGTLTIIPPG